MWKEALGGFCFMCCEHELFLPREKRGGEGVLGAVGKEGGEVPAGRRGPGLPGGSVAPAALPQGCPHHPVSASGRGLQKWGCGGLCGRGPGACGDRPARGWQREAPLGPGADRSAGLDAAEPKLLCHCCGCCRGDW